LHYEYEISTIQKSLKFCCKISNRAKANAINYEIFIETFRAKRQIDNCT
jgi:hypothetical protein